MKHSIRDNDNVFIKASQNIQILILNGTTCLHCKVLKKSAAEGFKPKTASIPDRDKYPDAIAAKSADSTQQIIG